MSEKRYLVPEGMLRAAGYAFMRCLADGKYLNAALEAALRWQSENPIVPTNGQLWAGEMAVSGQGKGPFEGCSAVIAEWQRSASTVESAWANVERLPWLTGSRMKLAIGSFAERWARMELRRTLGMSCGMGKSLRSES